MDKLRGRGGKGKRPWREGRGREGGKGRCHDFSSFSDRRKGLGEV